MINAEHHKGKERKSNYLAQKDICKELSIAEEDQLELKLTKNKVISIRPMAKRRSHEEVMRDIKKVRDEVWEREFASRYQEYLNRSR